MIKPEIIDAIDQAIATSTKEENTIISFAFNGVTVNVQSDSDPELILRDYLRALYNCIDKNINPHPNPVLTDDEKANDLKIANENRLRQQKQERERAKSKKLQKLQ